MTPSGTARTALITGVRGVDKSDERLRHNRVGLYREEPTGQVRVLTPNPAGRFADRVIRTDMNRPDQGILDGTVVLRLLETIRIPPDHSLVDIATNDSPPPFLRKRLDHYDPKTSHHVPPSRDAVTLHGPLENLYAPGGGR